MNEKKHSTWFVLQDKLMYTMKILNKKSMLDKFIDTFVLPVLALYIPCFVVTILFMLFISIVK